nr:9115_t:CDS:2 [Entrophospora candida]
MSRNYSTSQEEGENQMQIDHDITNNGNQDGDDGQMLIDDGINNISEDIDEIKLGRIRIDKGREEVVEGSDSNVQIVDILLK